MSDPTRALNVTESPERATDRSVSFNGGNGGIVVSIPPPMNVGLRNSDLAVRRYVGIQGRAWPAQLTSMPPLLAGKAQEEYLDVCISYWCKIVSRKDFGEAVCLYVGGEAKSSEFVFAGFDCGYYSDERDSLSLVYEDLILDDRLMLDDFRGKLNRYCLFSVRKDAERFLETVGECLNLRKKHSEAAEKASVFKVFIHRMCLPEPMLRGVILETETFTRLTIKSGADAIEWLRRQLSVEHDLERLREVSDLTSADWCHGISYDSRLGVEADADEQIKDILSCFTSDGIAALNSSHGLKTAIHVAIHGDFNPAIYISPETIRALAQFKAGLDITAGKDHIKRNI